ncbi:MAG: hypothetical protein CVU65_18000 [Deltaproteobacteria bacterium HGW-Deltaproteobacteria-22]|nr:MAG: hypothetical protein CVU65_18000 [Deltaproteobacteria bacterium HGW-Deltaproteobacteria-22]
MRRWKRHHGAVCHRRDLLHRLRRCDDGNTVTETCLYGEQSCTVCAADCSEQPGVLTGWCGDNLLNGTEDCDDGNTVTETCLYGEQSCTVCAADCTEESGAIVGWCGDNLLNGAEDCDDGNTVTETCLYGEQSCTVCAADCTEQAGVLTGYCGDGVLFASEEECDTTVDSLTCVDEGFDAGTLACGALDCLIDRSDCFDFVDVTFTNCAQTGNTGPSQAQCDTAYAATALNGNVTITSGIQYWTVPDTGDYTIEVWGAQGGNHNFGVGGNGARVKGTFSLTAGQVLKILVGQKGKDGTNYDVGGGGGSFVTLSDDTPLIVAGGGGAAGNCGPAVYPTMIGKAATGSGFGGAGGNDGLWCGCGGDGSPGGGFHTNGSPTGGQAFILGGLGDSTERPSQCVDSGLGGFGGGGNGGNGGGGGGGYQGGNGGGSIGGVPGEGGYSYNGGANPQGEDGVRPGHGLVRIVRVP